jgi:hypothetical protein
MGLHHVVAHNREPSPRPVPGHLETPKGLFNGRRERILARV